MRRRIVLLKIGNKSIIFSLDVLLAFISTITLVTGSFFYMSQVQSLQWGQPGIYIISLDTLHTLKIDKTLANAYEFNDSTNLTLYMNYLLENNMCAEFEFYNKSGSLRLSVNRTLNGSSCGNSSIIFVARRTFIINDSVYYATMKSWYKNE